MCGMASTDGTMSVVPAMLAERLSLPQLTLAAVVEAQGDQVRIKRDGDVATDSTSGIVPPTTSVAVSPSRLIRTWSPWASTTEASVS